MIKDKPILKSIIWTFVILIFPVVSGVITQVLMMNNIQTMFIQGCFMLISLIIPIVYMRKFKISFKKFGLIKIENGSAKKVLFFLPLVIAETPFLLVGIRLNSIKYIITLLFFTIAVGISEEIYFRGIILKLLEEKYPKKKSIIISALVFGIGHIASIFAGRSILIMVFQILNALVFGIIATEIVTITKSLIPIIIWHFVFNFVNIQDLT
ncbi:lysostaphin resistance A-like protein [Terrisporobacter glycolicus]|uniref:lysostaphin resistance A-like protein n=1 Tax=Terrisporobacter glycolicus TaxID=36841 RepID=UPI0034647BAA